MTPLLTRRNPQAVLDWLALVALGMFLLALAGAYLVAPARATSLARFSSHYAMNNNFPSMISSEYISSFPAYASGSQPLAGANSLVVNYH